MASKKDTALQDSEQDTPEKPPAKKLRSVNNKDGPRGSATSHLSMDGDEDEMDFTCSEYSDLTLCLKTLIS